MILYWKNKFTFLFLILFLNIAYCAMEPELWNVPPLPLSEVVWKDKEVEFDGELAHWTCLKTSLSKEEIIEFYKKNLTQNGWRFKEIKDGFFLVFEKPGKFMYVMIKKDLYSGYKNEVYLTVTKSNLCKCNKCGFKKENFSQISQRNLSDIPLYPKSKPRFIFNPSLQENIALYETDSSVLEITKFYRKNLKRMGWEEIDVFNSKYVRKFFLNKNMRILYFQKGKDTLLINIFTPNQNFFKKSTLIVIVKNPESLAKKEYLEELLKRKE